MTKLINYIKNIIKAIENFTTKYYRTALLKKFAATSSYILIAILFMSVVTMFTSEVWWAFLSYIGGVTLGVILMYYIPLWVIDKIVYWYFKPLENKIPGFNEEYHRTGVYTNTTND